MSEAFKLSILVSLIMFFYAFTARANYFHDVEVLRVIDGDTISVTIPNLPDVFGKKISVRLAGIDTPEIRGKCAYEKEMARKAKDRTEGIIMKGDIISLGNVKRDKYFRLLADVLVDSENVSAALVKEGLAVTYSGGRKKDWCSYRKIR